MPGNVCFLGEAPPSIHGRSVHASGKYLTAESMERAIVAHFQECTKSVDLSANVSIYPLRRKQFFIKAKFGSNPNSHPGILPADIKTIYLRHSSNRSIESTYHFTPNTPPTGRKYAAPRDYLRVKTSKPAGNFTKVLRAVRCNLAALAMKRLNSSVAGSS